MDKRNLEILKMLGDTRDCSIPWNSIYNIAIREGIKELEIAEKENKELKEYIKKLDELNGKDFIFRGQIKELADFSIEATNRNTEYDVGFRNGIRYITKCLLHEEYTEDYEILSEEDEEIDIDKIKELYINDIKSVGESQIKCWTGRSLDVVFANKINTLIKIAKQINKKLEEK